MSFIVSIQGGMAAGKTTLAHRLKERLPEVHVSFENPSTAIGRVKELGLDKFKEDDFIEIQRIFINSEIERYQRLKKYGKVIIDLGPEEIEFYTLYFPKSIGQHWNIENRLAKELVELRNCRLAGILFLDADPKVLLARKEHDTTRKRGFFEHYLQVLYPYKKPWFEQFDYTTFLNVDAMSIEETEAYAMEWLEKMKLIASTFFSLIHGVSNLNPVNIEQFTGTITGIRPGQTGIPPNRLPVHFSGQVNQITLQ